MEEDSYYKKKIHLKLLTISSVQTWSAMRAKKIYGSLIIIKLKCSIYYGIELWHKAEDTLDGGRTHHRAESHILTHQVKDLMH